MRRVLGDINVMPNTINEISDMTKIMGMLNQFTCSECFKKLNKFSRNNSIVFGLVFDEF